MAASDYLRTIGVFVSRTTQTHFTFLEAIYLNAVREIIGNPFNESEHFSLKAI